MKTSTFYGIIIILLIIFVIFAVGISPGMLGVFRNKPDIVGNTIINGTISDLRYTPSQNMYSSTWHIVFADGNWLLVACPATNVNAPHEVDAYTTDISLLKKIKIGHAYALIIKNGKLVDIQESSI